MTTIRVELPAHLRNLARVDREVSINVEDPPTLGTVLDALERDYPTLQGAIRDHVTKQRRAFVRFFACQEDLSHEPHETPLPRLVVEGREPLLVIGAIAGGHDSSAHLPSKAQLWTGRVLTVLVTLFLLMDIGIKLARAQVAIDGTVQLGYPESVVFPLGAILGLCLLLYVIPRTAVLGAVLLTGYLGGAIATHVRVGNPLFSHILFPIYVAAFLWGGLYLRDPRVRRLL